MHRLLNVFAAYLILCASVRAQPPDDEIDKPYPIDAYVSLQVSSAGNVSVSVETFGLPEAQGRLLGSAVPAALGCRWTGDFTDYSVKGLCRGFFTPAVGASTSPLRLAPLVQMLHDRGIALVTVHVSCPK